MALISGKSVSKYTNKKESNFASDYYSSDPRNMSNDDILLLHDDGYFENLDWVKFDRYYSVDLSKEGPSGRHYIFFCRPDLNLVDPKI